MLCQISSYILWSFPPASFHISQIHPIGLPRLRPRVCVSLLLWFRFSCFPASVPRIRIFVLWRVPVLICAWWVISPCLSFPFPLLESVRDPIPDSIPRSVSWFICFFRPTSGFLSVPLLPSSSLLVPSGFWQHSRSLGGSPPIESESWVLIPSLHLVNPELHFVRLLSDPFLLTPLGLHCCSGFLGSILSLRLDSIPLPLWGCLSLPSHTAPAALLWSLLLGCCRVG